MNQISYWEKKWKIPWNTKAELNFYVQNSSLRIKVLTKPIQTKACSSTGKHVQKNMP